MPFHDEKERLKFLVDATEQALITLKIEMEKNFEDKFDAAKAEYINEVRMRKHDMRPHMKQLNSAKNLMQHYVDNLGTVDNVRNDLQRQLKRFSNALGYLSDIIEHLSDEEQFGEPQSFDVHNFFLTKEKQSSADEYKVYYSFDKKTLKSYLLKLAVMQTYVNADADNLLLEGDRQQARQDAIASKMLFDEYVMQARVDATANSLLLECDKRQAKQDAIAKKILFEEDAMQKQKEMVANNCLMEREIESNRSGVFSERIPSINVSPKDFRRLVNNIIDNAKKHGFTDPNRKDYVVQITMSIDVESDMLHIDFRNNGTPLPDGLNKRRYGIRGEKAGKTGGTGLGGHYVKLFAEHYRGDYDIFMEGEWTVVRISLPIK